ncbi:unnamed protein product, partial [Schistosoma mattheei]
NCLNQSSNTSRSEELHLSNTYLTTKWSIDDKQQRNQKIKLLENDKLAQIKCRLETKELWEKFNELGTEMIITKSGRRMFPVIRASFSGLESEAKYLVLMDIIPVDCKRYRYAYHRSSWLVAGKADPELRLRHYVHPDSPFTGEQLMRQTVSFEKLKLTNNVLDRQGYMVVGGGQLETLDLDFVLLGTRQQGVPEFSRELVLPDGFDPRVAPLHRLQLISLLLAYEHLVRIASILP